MAYGFVLIRTNPIGEGKEQRIQGPLFVPESSRIFSVCASIKAINFPHSRRDYRDISCLVKCDGVKVIGLKGREITRYARATTGNNMASLRVYRFESNFILGIFVHFSRVKSKEQKIFVATHEEAIRIPQRSGFRDLAEPRRSRFLLGTQISKRDVKTHSCLFFILMPLSFFFILSFCFCQDDELKLRRSGRNDSTLVWHCRLAIRINRFFLHTLWVHSVTLNVYA